MLKMSDEKKKPSVTIGVKFVDAPIKKALSDTAMEKQTSIQPGNGSNRLFPFRTSTKCTRTLQRFLSA